MFWPGTFVLAAAGFIGVVVLAATAGNEILKLIPIANAALKRAAIAFQPAILLVVLAAVGTAVSARVGTRSILVDWASGTEFLPGAFDGFATAAVAGAVIGFLVFLVDRVSRPLWNPEGGGPDIARDWTPASLATGITYGGITEEIMMRWGLMGLVLWLLAVMTGAAPGEPSAIVVVLANAVAALLFAAGHLPAAVSTGLRSRAFILRTLALNFAVGLFFGWLFWRWNLEAAMVAHAAFHVGGAAYALILRRQPTTAR